MNFLISLLLIGGGLVAIFYFRPKTQNNITEIKYMQTKTISELIDMFNQMDSNGLGNDYREYVELKGVAESSKLFETPFSNRKVVYYNSKLSQVVEHREDYYDKDGRWQTRTSQSQDLISNEKSSQEISMKDGSSEEPVILEINGIGCQLDIPKSYDRFVSKGNMNNYRCLSSFSYEKCGPQTLGFQMVEETIDANQNLYVIGEAFRVGNTIHIGKPQDSKKPFIVSTKSEEDLINSSNQKAFFMLICGIIAIVVGIFMIMK